MDNSLNIENHDMSGHDITINKNDKDALEILSQKDENSKLTVCKLINLICQNIAQLI